MTDLDPFERLAACTGEDSPGLPEAIYADFPPEILSDITRESSGDGRKLRTILFLLRSLSVEVLSKRSTFMSVREARVVRRAIGEATTIGITSCLLPGVGASPRSPQQDLPPTTKYQRLSSTVETFVSCFEEVSMRCELLGQLGPLLSGLYQLAHAPLMKPSKSPPHPSKFQMTQSLWESFTADQNKFRGLLERLLGSCQLSVVMKELMVLYGSRDSPRWLQPRVSADLIDALLTPKGLESLFTATCERELETRSHSERINVIAKLVTTPHGSRDRGQYFASICQQLVNLLLSGSSPDNSAIVVTACLMNLHETRPDVFQDQIVNETLRVLKTSIEKLDEKTLRGQVKKLTDFLRNSRRIFGGSKFSHFSSVSWELIERIFQSVFYTFVRCGGNVLLGKSQVRLIREVLVGLLEFGELFSVCLEPELPKKVGEELKFHLEASGVLEEVPEPEELKPEDVATSLYELVVDDENLAVQLFRCLLQSHQQAKKDLQALDRRIARTKLLSELAGNSSLQKFLIKNPKCLLDFIQSLFNELLEGREAQTEDDNEILHMSLMLVTIILEQERPKDLEPFTELADFFQRNQSRMKLSESFTRLMGEFLVTMKNKNTRRTRFYQDESIDDLKTREFQRIWKYATDESFVVRAGGLRDLTKKISVGDSIALGKKWELLPLFLKNLEHEDSFLYLAAVEGLQAMALRWPQDLVQILVDEFKAQRVSPDNRVKLGEILVKITRELGEMAPQYKTVLIEGFLWGIRDEDSMVRASNLSCLGELCEILGFRLGHSMTEVLFAIGCVIETDQAAEARRAAVLVCGLLLRGLGRDALTDLGPELLRLYRSLKHLRNNDNDQVVSLHAQTAIEELDDIVQSYLSSEPSPGFPNSTNLRINFR